MESVAPEHFEHDSVDDAKRALAGDDSHLKLPSPTDEEWYDQDGHFVPSSQFSTDEEGQSAFHPDKAGPQHRGSARERELYGRTEVNAGGRLPVTPSGDAGPEGAGESEPKSPISISDDFMGVPSLATPAERKSLLEPNVIDAELEQHKQHPDFPHEAPKEVQADWLEERGHTKAAEHTRQGVDDYGIGLHHSKGEKQALLSHYAHGQANLGKPSSAIAAWRALGNHLDPTRGSGEHHRPLSGAANWLVEHGSAMHRLRHKGARAKIDAFRKAVLQHLGEE